MKGPYFVLLHRDREEVKGRLEIGMAKIFLFTDICG